MKIKSWTGNEVELRENMAVELGKPIEGCSAKPAGTRHIVNSLCDAELFDYECTMLHAPFVGDDMVQVYDDLYGEDIIATKRYKDLHPETECMYLIRHLSPDLRTSPDYEVK